MSEYENKRDEFRRKQAEASKKNEINTVLRLFVKRHYLALEEFADKGEIDVQAELDKIGERVIEWFNLSFIIEDTFGGFAPAPAVKNVSKPFALSSFLMGSSVRLRRVDVRKIQKQVLENARFREPKGAIDIIAQSLQLNEDDLGPVSIKDAKTAKEFLRALKGNVLLDSEDLRTKDMTGMFEGNKGLLADEKEIILGYLKSYIEFQYLKTVPQVAAYEAQIEMLIKDTSKELYVDEEGVTKAIEDLQKGLESDSAAGAIMQGRKKYNKQEFEALVEEKKEQLSLIVSEEARDLAIRILDDAMDNGAQSSSLLREYQNNMRKGFGAMVNVKKHFINIGLGGMAVFAGLYELTIKEYFSKSKTVWVNHLGEEVPAPDLGDKAYEPDIAQDDSYYEWFWKQLGYEEEQAIQLPGQKTKRQIYNLVDGDTQRQIGAIWNLCKLGYAMVVPIQLILTVVYGSAVPVGLVANAISLIRLLQLTMGAIAIYDQLPESAAEMPTTENEGGWVGFIISFFCWVLSHIMSKLRHLIAFVTFLCIDNKTSTGFLACVGLTQIIVGVYTLFAIERVDYNSAREAADERLLADLGALGFDLGRVDKQIEESFDDDGRTRDVSARLNATIKNVDVANQRLANVQTLTAEKVALQNLDINQQTLRIRENQANARGQDQVLVAPMAQWRRNAQGDDDSDDDSVDLTFD